MKLDTLEEVLNFCALKRAEMEACHGREGRFEVNGYSFGGYVFATRAIVGGPPDFPTEPLGHVEAVTVRMPAFLRMLLPASEHTRAFGHCMRECVKKSEAVGTLFMGETWMAAAPHPNMTQAEVEAWRKTQPADMGEFADKREGLVMMLEHKTFGRRTWRNMIERNPTRLVGWREGELHPESGRVVNLGAEPAPQK
jgi:hypothetical protein